MNRGDRTIEGQGIGIQIMKSKADKAELLIAYALRNNRRGRLIEHAAIAIGRSLLIAAILFLWAYAAGRWVDAQSISDPVSVFGALWNLIETGHLWPDLGQTVGEVLAGYFAGAAIAILLSFAFALMPDAEPVLRPFLLAVYSIPKIALAPLMVMWFGLGIAPKIILAATFVFFIVFMNAVAGIQGINQQLVSIVRVMGAGRWAVIAKVVIPSVVPFLILGLRISIPEAMTGAVIGEFISASQGLGYLVYSASNDLNMAVSMAALVVLVIVVGIGDFVLGVVEQRLPWKVSATVGSQTT